jgi:Fe-S-cluster containining protein
MALEFLAALFGPRLKLPADQVTRLPGAAKKAAAPHAAAIQATLDKISGLPGIADVKESKRLPRGTATLVKELLHHVDAYHDALRTSMGIGAETRRPGEKGGTNGCIPAPLGVSAIEALHIYRTIRTWPDFPDMAKRLAELGEQQFKDIQALSPGAGDKVRVGGKQVQQGRVVFAQRLQPCPFLDTGSQRCRIWEQRPIACRYHHPVEPPDGLRPDHEAWPKGVKAKNLRLPVRGQVTVQQLDKRMALELSPFLYASILQLLQLAEGKQIQEAGEAPVKLQQDGNVARPANRNVAHAKKFQKKKRKKA